MIWEKHFQKCDWPSKTNKIKRDWTHKFKNEEETSAHLPELHVTKCSRCIFSVTFKHGIIIAE